MLTLAICLSVMIGLVFGFRKAGVALAVSNAPGTLTRSCVKSAIGFLVLTIVGAGLVFLSKAAIILAFGTNTADLALPAMYGFGLFGVVAFYFAAHFCAYSARLMHHISTSVQALP